MSKKPNIILYCPKCGVTPLKDENQSNENWSVIPAICTNCNVRLKIKIS